jgi:hypothetical protein
MQLFGFLLFVVIFVVAQAIIVWLASLVRRRVFRDISLAGALAISHAAIVLGCAALYPTGFFTPLGADDIYGSYLFVPGAHILWLGQKVALALWPKLQTMMSYHSASLICIVAIPGVVCLVLGTLQWYLIGLLWRSKYANHSVQPTATNYAARGD